MDHTFPKPVTRTVPLLAVAASMALAGCSSVENFLAGDKVDYRSQAGKVAPLEVPPDLTQLSRDSRFPPQGQGGTVSASTFQAGQTATAAAPLAAPGVAKVDAGALRMVRDGDERWLVTPLPPEQAWPLVKAFWLERGFTLAYENPEAGVLETDWAENRAKLPQDFVRNTLGRVIDRLYDTGYRDKYIVRVERAASGSEVYISHRGLEEVYVSPMEDRVAWTARPSDPALEADMFSRLMVKMGGSEPAARAAVAQPAAQPARARALAGQPTAALQMDDPFDRAWRRVGVALDRRGFTVEDRDRTGGLYFVRLVEGTTAAKPEPGFFSKLFSWGGSAPAEAPSSGRYRVQVRGEGERTVVSVLSAQGSADTSATAQRIVTMLVEELK
jgi:outer membrane protein assembly factor BamC